jgi:hypothetical protein
MRTHLSVLIAAVLVAACGNDKTSADSAAGPAAGAATPTSESTASAATPQGGAAADAAPVAAAANAPVQGLGGRSGELINPDNSTVVFLYYNLAGLTPPIDNWVEQDNRVQFAQALEKAERRKAVRAELESAAAAVKDIGAIRLSMNANLSEYDPSYGEFAVRALAPSSVISFNDLGQKVELRFANGRQAQIWRVPQAESQAVRDKIGYGPGVGLDVLLRITGVQPGPGGGTINTEVVEYQMQTQNGLTIARVQVAQR